MLMIILVEKKERNLKLELVCMNHSLGWKWGWIVMSHDLFG